MEDINKNKNLILTLILVMLMFAGIALYNYRNQSEQKVETIGSQYPIFVRNGHINYHEFSIGGLISYLMDPIFTENNVSRTGFYTQTEWEQISNQEKSTALTSENFEREARFRKDVINWLTDGKNKEFYSLTEGHMIVRLSNIQLTPETKLGRMIYSFTAQATEVEKISVDEEEGETVE